MSDPETIYLDDYRSLVTVSGGGWPKRAWVPKADYLKLKTEKAQLQEDRDSNQRVAIAAQALVERAKNLMLAELIINVGQGYSQWACIVCGGHWGLGKSNHDDDCVLEAWFKDFQLAASGAGRES